MAGGVGKDGLSRLRAEILAVETQDAEARAGAVAGKVGGKGGKNLREIELDDQ